MQGVYERFLNEVDTSHTGRTVQGRAPLVLLTLCVGLPGEPGGAGSPKGGAAQGEDTRHTRGYGQQPGQQVQKYIHQNCINTYFGLTFPNNLFFFRKFQDISRSCRNYSKQNGKTFNKKFKKVNS